MGAVLRTFGLQRIPKAEGERPSTLSQGRSGALFKDVNALRNADDDAEDADEVALRKFNEFTFFGRLARNRFFEYITLGVIVFNALYLGYDCDYGARWGKPESLYDSSLWGFMLLDNFFCAFFTFEVFVRFVGYVSKCSACTDKPFIFDVVLVLFMILETWVLAILGPIDALKQVSVLRLLRLARLLRMGKIMRYCPELQLIVKGMAAAVRSVAVALGLLMLVLYIFSIIFTSEYHQGLKADDDPDIAEIEVLFGSMGKSMRHLLIFATILDDITACCNAIRGTEKVQMMGFFITCVIICSFTLFNMLLGILCEVVEATKNGAAARSEHKRIHDTIIRFCRSMDDDDNGMISRSEFLKMGTSPEILKTLEELHIKPDNFLKFADLLFTPTSFELGVPLPSMPYEAAVGMIMKLRPGQNINCCDFNYMKHKITSNYQGIRSRIRGLELILEDAAARQEAQDQGHAMACAELVASQKVEEPIHEPDPKNSMFCMEDMFGGNEEMGQTSDQDNTLSRQTSSQPARPKAMAASQVKSGKKTARKRPQSLKLLARSHSSDTRPPPMCSVWKEPSPGNVDGDLGGSTPVSQPVSPRSGKLRPKPIDSDVVAHRLNRLMDQRRVVGQKAWNVQSNRLQDRLMDDRLMVNSINYQPPALLDVARSPKDPSSREVRRWDEPQFIS